MAQGDRVRETLGGLMPLKNFMNPAPLRTRA
jgi:hypothetical protein